MTSRPKAKAKTKTTTVAWRSGLDERVQAYLASSPMGLPEPSNVSRLAGDASNRLYYRVHFEKGRTKILTLLPGPFEPSALPFLEVGELFRAIPLRVPVVDDVDGARGILLQEDLGDRLLQDEIAANPSPATKASRKLVT